MMKPNESAAIYWHSQQAFCTFCAHRGDLMSGVIEGVEQQALPIVGFHTCRDEDADEQARRYPEE